MIGIVHHFMKLPRWSLIESIAFEILSSQFMYYPPFLWFFDELSFHIPSRGVVGNKTPPL
jgi:hypothetical protein